MRLVLALVLSLLVAPAAAQFGGCLPAFCGPPATPPVTCTEGNTFIARTSGLDTTHINAYQALICGLVADGVWAKLDVLYTFATQDQTTANLNLVSVGATITSHGPSIVWTADRGYVNTDTNTFTGSYLDTAFTPPLGNFTNTNAHASVWSNTSAVSSGISMGLGGAGQNTTVQLIPRFTDDHIDYRLNSTSAAGPLTATTTDGRGFYLANKDGGNSLTGYRNGVVVLGPLVDATGPAWGGQILITAANAFPGTATFGSATQISAASLGGPLTGSDVTNFNTRLRTYMTTMGIP